ncbi:unnamed protein product [Cylindrotheca closterium]|uniref:RNase H type-1 domain-containing protein n=1 Tax=Cylindrotheca closterium TaxID=2856 RepID=A0AAD2CSE0_9STRA|nr:unnamed protein product [Cylindrotheca closterium]
MPYYNRLIIYFDGASKSNPYGPAGFGWTLYEMNRQGNHGMRIANGQGYLGYHITNNQAEYEGLESALAYIKDKDIGCTTLHIRGDSELVIEQISGKYRVRSKNLIDHVKSVKSKLKSLETNFDDVKYNRIDRGQNEEADKLANDAIEQCD